MIRINLLHVERKKKKAKKLPAEVMTGIAAFAVTVIAALFFTFYLTSKISDMKAEKASKEQRLEELKAMIKEVENYERDNKIFEEKTKIIEQLRKNQGIPLRMLDEVSALLPKGVWLTALIESGGNTTLEGYAFTNADLVGYVDNLKGSKYLQEVTLIESKSAVVENVSLYQFKLTFKVRI
ncbi:MAG: PilN domain-containing protein [Nitrospirae bacterium]|nr:PilN domain-containing protein [Nitrospirota bacterium]